MHSYVVKNKSSGMRNVLMLSTIQPILGVTKDDQKKNRQYTSSTILQKVELTSSTKEPVHIPAKSSLHGGQ